jgi:hypothetical protein
MEELVVESWFFKACYIVLTDDGHNCSDWATNLDCQWAVVDILEY